MTQSIRHELRVVAQEIHGVTLKDLIIKDTETGSEAVISAMNMGMSHAGFFEHVLRQEIGVDGFAALYQEGARRPVSSQTVNRIWNAYCEACSCE